MVRTPRSSLSLREDSFSRCGEAKVAALYPNSPKKPEDRRLVVRTPAPVALASGQKDPKKSTDRSHLTNLEVFSSSSVSFLLAALVVVGLLLALLVVLVTSW